MFFRSQYVYYFIIGIVLGLVVMLVSGCAEMRGDDWAMVPDQRQPRASLTQYAHEVRFADGNDSLSLDERGRIAVFLERTKAGYGDRFQIAGEADSSSLAGRRKEIVAAYLDNLGFRPRPIGGDFGIGRTPKNTVRVILRRYVVTLPGCPDWTSKPGDNSQNRPGSNWSCATATNLGLMVADPADLVAGRRMGAADGEFSALSIDRYRKGKTTPLDPEDISVIEGQQKTGKGQ